MGLPTLLALASLFSQRYTEYDKTAFPNVHNGVDSGVLAALREPFDYVVVGSGFAGSFLARQLSSPACSPPARVLLLEAGGLPTFDSVIPFTRLQDISHLEYGYMTVPQKKAAKAMKEKRVHLMVGKSMGGDSVVDSGLYVPPNLQDFHRWSYLYNLDGWGYVDMKPYMFKLPEERELDRTGKLPDPPLKDFNMTRSEILHSLSRGIAPNLIEPLQFAWLQAGKKMNYSSVDGIRQQMFHDGGFFLPKTMAHNGIKLNPAAQFLRRMGDNLVVVSHSSVQRLIYNNDASRVIGVEFLDTNTNKSFTTNVAREVLLTAGTIGSAKILLQSGIGPRELLQSQSLPVVQDLPIGKRLNDRVSVNLYIRIHPQFVEGLKSQLNDPRQLYAFLINGTGILANASVTGCSLIKSGYLNTPDLLMEMKPIGILGIEDLLSTNNYDKHILQQIDPTDRAFKEGCLQVKLTVLRPFSVGTMWIWRKFDDTFVPRMNPSYLGDERDTTALVQGARYVEEMLKDEFLAALGTELMYPEFEGCPTPILPSSDDYWRCVMGHLATTGNHLSGTVPLGSAVDGRLRVKGVHGVRVMDASVFPRTSLRWSFEHSSGCCQPRIQIPPRRQRYSMLIRSPELFLTQTQLIALNNRLHIH